MGEKAEIKNEVREEGRAETTLREAVREKTRTSQERFGVASQPDRFSCLLVI